MAEQFAFDDSFGNGATIHGDQGLLRAIARCVYGFCDHFFARPALTRDQHGDVRRRHLRDDFGDLLHLHGFADDPEFFLEPDRIVYYSTLHVTSK